MAEHFKGSRKPVAASIQEECSRNGSSNTLNQILDELLDPRNSISDRGRIEDCRWLMSAGRTPDDFFSTVRMYDNATTCGLVWTAHFVAYRCRTCGISPCMSLCAACFQRGNHEGHDFNMFRSQAGGACDCGDTSVMKESGFCHKHGPNAQLDKPPPPKDLLCVAEIIFPRLFLRLVQHFRHHGKPFTADSYTEAIQGSAAFLTMLHQFSQLGAAMRSVMTNALVNHHLYKCLTDAKCDDTDLQIYNTESYLKYNEARLTLDCSIFHEEINCLLKSKPLSHSTFLDELVFWTVVFEFPQELVCFLLNMLPDDTYKEAFTRAFVNHYSRIATILVKSKDHDKLSSRVVHVSVQLFSNEALSLRMTEELKLLLVMVVSLKDMMQQILIPCTLHDADKNLHSVVDCNKHVMKDHRYWSIVSDLNNVLSHKPIVMMFLSDRSLLEIWFNFLSVFQGMNVNRRELHQHIKYEPNTYYAAFSAELEASASIMWALTSHLKDSSTLHLTKEAVSYCLTALQDWFDALGIPNTDMVDPLQVSFHLPLHRYFAVLLNHAVRYQNENLENVLPSVEMLKYLLIHPLKIQVAFCEILCGMWVRNGLQIKGQAMTYVQCHFCNSMVDADIFLLQLCATHVDPDWFIMSVLERFHILDWLSFDPNRNTSFMDPEHEMPMLEGALTFLATLLSVRTNIGLQDDDLTKLEMITLLCMGDKTHSQLMDLMPEKCGSLSQNKNFEATLARVADYKAPNFEAGGNMLQGMYMPKTEVWEYDYDPIYVLLRAVHRRDFQASLDRFSQFAHQTGKFKGAGSLWPPFRLTGPVHPKFVDPRNLLHCKTMQGFLFTILYKAVIDPSVSDIATSLCIYLLEMAVKFPATECVSGKELLHVTGASEDEVHDLQFKDWFTSSFILTNLSQTIYKVVISSEGSDSSMEVDNIETEWELLNSVLETQLYDIASEAGTPEDNEPLPRSLVPLSLPAASESQALVPVSGNMMIVPSEPRSGTEPSESNQVVAVPNALLFLPVLSGSQSLPTSNPSPMALPSSQSMQLHSPTNNNNRMTVMLRRMFTDRKPAGMANSAQPMSVSGQLETEEEKGALKALPASHANYVEINESILSLLIKLHSKLSSKPNSYVPYLDKSSTSQQKNETRIGDGAHFVGMLLDKISQMSIRNARAIQEICCRLWPQQTVKALSGETLSAKDFSDKDDRRRRARERQQKLMAEFASKQKAFMEQAKIIGCDSEELTATPENMDESYGNSSTEYDCVICNQTSPSTLEKPIGLVCLLQASSVLGYACSDPAPLILPSSEESAHLLRLNQRRSAFMDKQREEMGRNFDDDFTMRYAQCFKRLSQQDLFMVPQTKFVHCSSFQISRLMSVNIGWEGGVFVRTCGHHLHLDCHKAYIKSLRQNQHNQRQQSLAVETGEYWCPFCRQLANTVLPIAPDVDETAVVIKRKHINQKVLALELLQLLNSNPSVPQQSKLMKAMSCIMEDMTNATYPQYKICSQMQCIEVCFLFISSVARTNLELDIVMRGGNLCNEPTSLSTRPCFEPLLHVLATHSKLLPVKRNSQLVSQITGIQIDDDLSSLSRCEKEVPLLLKDIIAVMLQLILTLPLHTDKAYFTCVVRMLFNIAYIQAAASLSCRLSRDQRQHWKEMSRCDSSPNLLTTLGSVLGTVIDNLEHCALYMDDDEVDRAILLKKWSLAELDHEIKQMCLPFMRIASLLQHHIYKESLLSIKETQKEFNCLSKFLELGECTSASLDTNSYGDSASCLVWIADDPKAVIQNWCQDYMAFVNIAPIAAGSLLKQHIWHQPRLLQLPHNYDQIFQCYHQKACTSCNGIPKEPSLCLACGALVCLREYCCKREAVGEAVQHSINCGAGTAVFLAVNSSTIIVIRGKRACLWGSVYLDSFGEEDRDLKRGKPLYLSEERYRLLEQQWLTHSFDHTNKRWVFHKENL